MTPESRLLQDRRRFLGSTLGVAAGALWFASCGSEVSESVTMLPDGMDPKNFIVHGPLTIESKRSVLRDEITPTDKVFVRGNLGFPDKSILADADAWALAIDGVAKPGSMTLKDLKALGSTTITAVLQCSGNGRFFFEHGPSGSLWGVGAAANVQWTGVPVKKVLEAMGGAVDGARFITGTGGEPIDAALNERDLVVERSIPLEKGMEDAILAWELNGEPVNISHGGPLRLVVPGFYGVNNVKYLKRLAATADESDAKIQVSSYRVRPIGEKGAADQPSMWAMNVKSWVDDPLGDKALKVGIVDVTGVAFCGESPIQSVEVSTDGGATWAPAEMVGTDMGPYAWRRFSYRWDASPGQHQIASRATSADGKVQPKDRVENHRGYAHNGWSDPSITVNVG